MLVLMRYNIPCQTDEERAVALEPLVNFAKELNLYEPPKKRLVGREALLVAKEKRLNFFVQASDLTVLEVEPQKTTFALVSMLLAHGQAPETIFAEVEESKRDAMYLTQALRYLDNYGNDCRVLAWIRDVRQSPGMSLHFKWRRDDKWKTEMVGGLEFHGPTYPDGSPRDPDHVGFSVHT